MRLKTLLGGYPVTRALKDGRVRSPFVELDIADVKVPHTAFKRVVRDLEFDVAEIAIVTFLMAKAFGKPLRLLPAVMFGRFQHPYLVSTSAIKTERSGGKAHRHPLELRHHGGLDPRHAGRRLRRGPGQGELGDFRGRACRRIPRPAGTERAAEGKTPLGMLLAGEVDAAVLADPVPKDERLRSVIPDPAAAAADWHRRKGAIQINHMVAVKNSLGSDVSQEVFSLLLQSKKLSGEKPQIDTSPFGLEANRRNLEVAIDYVYRQELIPRRYGVDELFD